MFPYDQAIAAFFNFLCTPEGQKICAFNAQVIQDLINLMHKKSGAADLAGAPKQ